MGDNDKPRRQKHGGAPLWKKGQSGNPRGATSMRLTPLLKQILATPIDPKNGPTTRADMLMEIIVERALEGDFKFCREILDRVEGKVPEQQIQYEGGPLMRQVAFDVDRVC